jgi:hypothetical protein
MKMSEKISNEQMTTAMFTLTNYIHQLQTPIELECMQNTLLGWMQEINRQIVKVKEEQQARIQKEIDAHKARRSV